VKRFLLKLADQFGLYPLFNRYTSDTATIFMLHRIRSDDRGSDRDITPHLLNGYFGYLRQKKYNIVSLKAYINALITGQRIHKTVVFTVDDGYRDFYLYAFPVFRKYCIPATIFITSDFIRGQLVLWWNVIEDAFGRTTGGEISLDFMNEGTIPINDTESRNRTAEKVIRFVKGIPDSEKLAIIDRLVKELAVNLSPRPSGDHEPLKTAEILEMSRSGIDFHPHTKTHPIMSKIPLERKIVEAADPKDFIESLLGKTADIFCYPNGQPRDFDEETISVLKSTGYVAAVVGYDGFDSTKEKTDMFRIKRFGLPSDPIMFKQYISGLEYFKRRYL
jgi:peptidoglycan/xylan/chitin deacetylase (PgdA/CDA1 family)